MSSSVPAGGLHRRIGEDPHPREARDRLPEEIESLAVQVGDDVGDAGDVAARSGQGADEAVRDRVVGGRHDDGDGGRRRRGPPGWPPARGPR